MKTDAQLKTDVVAELKWEPCVHEEGIKVSTKDGAVTLNGTVPNYAEKLFAERAVKRVAGVKEIVEEMEVKLPGLQKLPDQEVVVIVVNTLKWHAWIPNHIKASVENGWVTLSGEVASVFQRQACEDAVRFITGVKGISNSIKLKTNNQATGVTELIEKSFNRSAAIDADQINVHTDSGLVTLTGAVSSWYARDEAFSAAWRAPGVTNVDDNLVLSERTNTHVGQLEQS